jgi:hypothetical protein
MLSQIILSNYLLRNTAFDPVNLLLIVGLNLPLIMHLKNTAKDLARNL